MRLKIKEELLVGSISIFIAHCCDNVGQRFLVGGRKGRRLRLLFDSRQILFIEAGAGIEFLCLL